KPLVTDNPNPHLVLEFVVDSLTAHVRMGESKQERFWKRVVALRNVQLISSADKRDEVGQRLNLSHVVAILMVVVNNGMTSSSRRGVRDKDAELLTCGFSFPGNA
ncbi:unnamed protein product, partial [Rangifer tarandus platyrhynchus]